MFHPGTLLAVFAGSNEEPGESQRGRGEALAFTACPDHAVFAFGQNLRSVGLTYIPGLGNETWDHAPWGGRNLKRSGRRVAAIYQASQPANSRRRGSRSRTDS